MAQWQRIGEDEFASYGKRSIVFAYPGGTYQVTVDDNDQNYIRMQHAGKEERWNIEIKVACNGAFRLAGVAYKTDDLLDDTYWYELSLTSPSTITYWGNQVVARSDREI